MIHKVVPPPISRQKLRKIVAMQEKLLGELCKTTVTSSDVTTAWVMTHLQTLGIEADWAREFASSRRQVLFGLMRDIADFPDVLKDKVKSDFAYDVAFDQAFSNPTLRPYRLHGFASLPEVPKRRVHDFLTFFYAPSFYQTNGYLLPPDTNGPRFDKEIFLAEFHTANPKFKVCPLCDGYPEGEEVDHFYPKKLHPALSCHPLNLVPICKPCNSAANKGQVEPLGQPPADPNAEWFHPYLSALADWTHMASWPQERQFRVEFDGGGGDLKLKSDDPLIQARLRTAEELLHLHSRWCMALKTKIGNMRSVLRVYRDKLGRPLNEQDIIEKVQELADEVCGNLGHDPYGLVYSAYLKETSDASTPFFQDLWDAAINDSLTLPMPLS